MKKQKQVKGDTDSGGISNQQISKKKDSNTEEEEKVLLNILFI